jgi:hypothetical protein
MVSLVERYAKQIAGVLSCFDRITITGTLPGICYADGMAGYLAANGIRIFDYPRFVEPMRDEIRANAEQISRENNLEIEYIRSAGAFRKEDRIKEILHKRGNHPGLVHIFSAMETCPAFTPRHDKATGRTYLKYKEAKCLHYYFYFLDEQFGLCFLRVPTWAPFRLLFYFNGHNWLANQLLLHGIGFTQLDNAFIRIDDWAKAQELADEFPVERLHRALDRWAEKYCPVVRRFPAKYHWSIEQGEYATDIVFFRQKELQPLYAVLSRTAIHAVKPDHVATFLGRKLDGRYKDELGNDFHTRVEGTRIKHRMGPVSIKLYDKQGLVLRIETTVNDVTFFRHYRTVEHRDKTSEAKVATMQKTIYSLFPLKQCMAAANRRYLDFLSELVDPSGGLRDVQKLAEPLKKKGRNYPGFNLFQQKDFAFILALIRGEGFISGFTNKTVRRVLKDRTGPQVSRLLKRMLVHGLIRKVGKTYKYYLTPLGRRVLLTALKLRELVVIPSLAGILAA